MTAVSGVAVARAVTGGLSSLLHGRSLLAMFAIAFGVALGYAVELINHAAVTELDAGVALLAGEADLEVRGPRSGFDESLYPTIARDPDVAVASPVVEVGVKVRGRSEPLSVLGTDVFRAAAISPALAAAGDARDAARPDAGRDARLDALRGDTIFPSAAAASWLAVKTRDTLVVQAGLRDVGLRVAGIAGPADAGSRRYAVMDIAAVQDLFAREGVLTRVELRLRPGADATVVQKRLQIEMPPGVLVAPPTATAAGDTSFSRAYRVNLEVLALVALFTGALLVYATQTLAVARRRAPFALLRTLGLTRRRLVGWVLAEAAWLGVIGAAIGIAAGFALAWFALRRYGPDLGAGFFRGTPIAPSVDPLTLLAFAALGVLAAVAGSAVPAHEAAFAAPARALRATDADLGVPAHANRAAWIALATAVVLMLLPPIAGLPLFGYAAIALLLIGGILALPALAKFVLRLAPAPRALAARLALMHLRAVPVRFSAMLAPVVASVALMVAMAIMVASFRSSLDAWLRVMLPADLYIGTPAESATLTAGDRRAITALPGVARAEFMRVTSLLVDARRTRVTLLARDIDPLDISSRLALIGATITPPTSAPPPAWINEAVADTWHLAPGSRLTLPIGGREAEFTVAGIWRDYARQQGAIVVERARYRALTDDDTVNEAALWLAPGANEGTVRTAVLRFAGGSDRLRVAAPGELRRRSLATFDRTFAVTYALEAAAVAIGLVGLSAMLIAQTLARSRELGMLRHVGATRRQIGAMLAIEGAMLATLGIAAGFALGFAVSLVLIHVVNPQSFHWGMDLSVPWTGLGALAVALVALALLTARLSARGATTIAAVRAVREDW